MAMVPTIERLEGSPPPYLHVVDALIIAPFLLGNLGNAFDVHDSFSSRVDRSTG